MKNLTKPELQSLLDVARKHSERDFWMILVTWNHGLRESETLSLTPLNFKGGKLTIQRLKGSKKTSQPTLLLESSGTRAAFEEFVADTKGRLFPTYRMDFWRKMQKYGAEAGIPEEKRHPHALKHTTGRLAYEAGVGIPEIQNILGHVNGKNTMVYMEATEEQAAEAFAAAFEGPRIDVDAIRSRYTVKDRYSFAGPRTGGNAIRHQDVEVDGCKCYCCDCVRWAKDRRAS